MKIHDWGTVSFVLAATVALVATLWRIDHLEGRLRVLERSVGNIQIEMAIDNFKAKGLIPEDAVRQ